MTDGVKLFLSDLGMMKYYNMFKIQGFDDESDIPYLTTFDLEDTIMITSQIDRATIMAHACVYRPRSEHAVYAWLCSNSLGYYFISFIQSELTDLSKIAQLPLPSEELYDELEIVLPGHRKRLERAVQRLKHEQTYEAAAECPVSHGWWGKPECLPQAKFDFLCVKASLFSSCDPRNIARIDFMVDSGSDVSTVQEDTLKKLNLELIGPVYSCGIHGGNHTNLYKGRLKIGEQELNIEVMGSNYDSLGSRVVRHFRHIIDGHQHIWLKGNYTDTLPAIVPIEFPVSTGISHLPQQSSCQVAVLPITSVDDPETRAAHRSTHDHHGTDNDDMHCDSQQTYPKSTPTNSDSPYSEHIPLTTQHGAQFQDASYVQEKELILKKHSSSCPTSYSSAVFPSSHKRNAPLSSKGKQSLKSNSYSSTKSSQKRIYNSSKSIIPKESLQRLSCGADGRSHPLNVGGASSDSVESSAGESSQSSSNVLPGERVSLCNILPPVLRDTDDDVDHLGDLVMVNGVSSFIQRLQVPEDNFNNIPRDVNLRSSTEKESLEIMSGSHCDHNLQTYYHLEKHNGVKSDLYDVVHIDGLHAGDSYDNGDGSNGEGKTLQMNYFPACDNEIKEIQLGETDMSVQWIQGDNDDAHIGTSRSIYERKHIGSGVSTYESPRKVGKFENT